MKLIKIVDGEPNFDSLPVLKLTCNTDVPINERIFAQAKVGLCDSGLFVRMWAFENDPPPESCLELHLLGPDGGIKLSAWPDKRFEALCGGKPAAVTAYTIAGEDLQGEYWGMGFLLDRKVFTKALALTEPVDDTIILGNVVKTNPHKSAVYPDGDGEFHLSRR